MRDDELEKVLLDLPRIRVKKGVAGEGKTGRLLRVVETLQAWAVVLWDDRGDTDDPGCIKVSVLEISEPKWRNMDQAYRL